MRAIEVLKTSLNKLFLVNLFNQELFAFGMLLECSVFCLLGDTIMFDVEVFYKTELGRMAVSDRAYGLHQRMRSALILIDGKTRWAQLQDILRPLGEPEAIVGQLIELGLLDSDHQLPPIPVFQAASQTVAASAEAYS
jgi:hypothetical protein